MLYAIVVVIALICDQALKYWTTAAIPLDTGVVQFIPGFLHFTNIHNAGAAFSFLQGARWLFVVLCVIFVLVIAWLLVKNIIASPGARWAAVFVVAGALGNCIDRILYGYVVDMLEFEFIRFPVFNLADVCITVGAVVFCVCLLLEKPMVVDGKTSAAGAPKETANAGKPAVEAAKPEPAKPEPAKPAADKQPKRAWKPKAQPAAKETADKPAPAQDKAKPAAKGKAKRKAKNAPKPYVTPATTFTPPSAPAIDPADPFAEWEHKAEVPADGADSAAPAESVKTVSEHEES